jgi:hypothetical protein
MIFYFHILLFFINGLLCAVIDQSNVPIFGENAVCKPFVNLINFSKAHRIKNKHDKIVFGDNTLTSIFDNLTYTLENTLPFFVSDWKVNKILLNSFVRMEYFPLFKKYYEWDPKGFLLLLLNSPIPFRMMAFYGVSTTGSTNLNFTDLAKIPDLFKDNEKEKNGVLAEKWYYFKYPLQQFTESSIVKLLKKPLISLKDWEERKVIVRYHLDLFSTIDPKQPFDSLFTYLLDNFSIINGNEIDLDAFYKLSIEIQNYETTVDDLRHSLEEFRWGFLFSVYSYHFIYSASSKWEPNYVNIKLICLSIILRDKTEVRYLREYFPLPKARLINIAIKIIEEEIIKGLKAISPKCSVIQKNFQDGKIPLSTNVTFIKILRNYSEGVYDMSSWELGVSKWIIKVYLYLLHCNERMIPKVPN